MKDLPAGASRAISRLGHRRGLCSGRRDGYDCVMIRRVLFIAFVAALLGGCEKPVSFPAESLSEVAQAAGAWRAYDADGDKQADFFLLADGEGRVDRIAYDRTGDQRPDEVIGLDRIPMSQCRHLVIILDGFAYDLVKAYRDEGHLRMFHPPSRLITVYPSMTDMCMEEIFNYVPCPAYEALYFDRRRNKLVGGSLAYLQGRNEPFNRLLDYRADLLWDAIGYVYPWEVFGKEVNDVKRQFDRMKTQEMIAYFVSSAGVGTIRGAEGQRACLAKVEQFVHQVLFETHGLVKITLLSDHGHTYTPGKRIPLEGFLTDRGWRLTESLSKPRDVVYIRFGLVTYASFATNSPADLAADLVGCEGVELASYAQGDAVVVLAPPKQKAIVRRKGGRYGYEMVSGDALRMKDVMGKLAGKDGFCEGQELLTATADHVYPAALERLHRAHFSLVQNPPDVVASLGDKWYSGSTSFGGAVTIASTHGSLNYTNSVTFIMSTAGALPAVMRSREVSEALKKATGLPFPNWR